MIKKIYKPKAKNEIALKTYIDATKEGNDRHNRNADSKCNSRKRNNIR